MPKGHTLTGKPRNKKYIPGVSARKRLFLLNHYKEKGMDFDLFLYLIEQDCLYCGEPPRRVNPYGSVYKGRKTLQRITEKFWNDCWIFANGIDKIEPSDNYSDPYNLAPCCKTCNWMKQLLGKETFIMQCNKIADRHERIERNVNEEE